VPVIGQSATHQGEDARSQVFASDPRQDQEAGIVDDEIRLRCRCSLLHPMIASRSLTFHALALHQLIERSPWTAEPDNLIFVNVHGAKLTRFGVRYIVDKLVE
jgi:hypothetical protein